MREFSVTLVEPLVYRDKQAFLFHFVGKYCSRDFHHPVGGCREPKVHQNCDIAREFGGEIEASIGKANGENHLNI